MNAEESLHPDTRALLAYGRALVEGQSPPHVFGAERLADRLFVIDMAPDQPALIRVFGGELAQLFGRDLKGKDFLALFQPGDQGLFRAFLAAIRGAGKPAVARAQGRTMEGICVGFEILFTPFGPSDATPRTANQALGLLQPLGGEAFLRGRTIRHLHLISLHPPTITPRQTLRLVVSNA